MKTEKNPPKKRWRMLLLCILFAVLLTVAALAYVFHAEIMLLYRAITTPPEVVQSQMEANDKHQQELLDQLVDVTMRDLTDEERELLAKGDLTYEEALALIRGETVAETTAVVSVVTTDATLYPESTGQSPEETTTTAATTTAATTIDSAALIARQEEIIAEIYLLRSVYLNEIDKLISDGKAEYIALPKKKHTLKNKLKIAERMLADGNVLEEECDAKINSLLSELEGILKKQSLDTSIISEIKSAYKEQKKIKKTELYNEYYPKMN